MHPLVGLGLVFLLVGVNGFFVAAEFSLVGSRHTRIAQLANEGNSSAKLAQKALQHLDNYIAATQLGITLASLALGWIGEPAIGGLLEELFHTVHLPIAEPVLVSISVAISFSLVTILHIVLGELTPKSIALQRPEGTALIIVRPTTWFLSIFRPVIWLMNSIGNSIVRMLGFEASSEHSQIHSAQELQMLVQSSTEAGMLSENEEQLLRRVFGFEDIPVRAIMRPRSQVDAVPINITIPALLDHVTKERYSRFPVYDGSMDRIVGLLYTRDILYTVIHHPELLRTPGDVSFQDGAFQLKSILRTPLFVPESVTVDDLLQRMKKTKTHFAIVLDEYGGMAGIATLEDVIEEIVGDVEDEYDTDLESMQGSAEQNEFVVDGLTSLADIADRFGSPDKSDEETLSTTIGGYIAERLDRIPMPGDITRYGNYEVRVLEMDGMRVARVQFTRDEPKEP